MGQRVYTTLFENVTVSANQDFFQLLAGSANGIELHYFNLTCAAASATPAETRVRLKRFPVTVTGGSGGSTPTISPIQSGDTKTSTVTAKANSTTPATTSGTAILLSAWQWNILLPLEYIPSPEDRPMCLAAEAIILDTPGGAPSLAMSGFIQWAELP